jgi:hypothetical protein
MSVEEMMLTMIDSYPTVWREELAWAAGFWQGEGSIGFAKDRRDGSRMLRMNAAQKDIRPLERFRAALLGIGVITLPRKRSGVRYWTAQNFEHVQVAVAMLWQFLSPPKKEQAFKALQAYKAAVPTKRAYSMKGGKVTSWHVR